MMSGSDYEQQTSNYNAISSKQISEIMRIVCYNQTIYDDAKMEDLEYAGLTLRVEESSVPVEVKPLFDQAAILIYDDESRSPVITMNKTIILYNVLTYLTLHTLDPLETNVVTERPIAIGSRHFSLTCRVHIRKTMRTFTREPSVHWLTVSGVEISRDDMAQTETFRNETTVISNLSFSSLNSSFAGNYFCQGRLSDPLLNAAINSTSPPISVALICKFVLATSYQS